MVRLKFLVFAFLVIGLGLAHLPVLSGPLRVRAEEGAAAQAGAATAEVARRVDARRAQVQSLALKLAATPEVVSAVHALQPAARPAPAPRKPGARPQADEAPGGPQPLTAERFAAVRAAAEAVLPKELQGAVVALVAQDVQFHAQVGGEASSDTAKLDVAALAKAGATVVDAFGAAHAFASVPVLWSGEPRLQPAAVLVVGAPLVDADTLEAAAAASGAVGLALVKGEAVVGGAGKEKALAEASLAQVKSGAGRVVLRRGQLGAMGPVQLPVFTDGDAMGGKAPLVVGTRQALEGTQLEVLAVAGTQAGLGALVAYQQSALMGLAGLLGLTLVWTLLMGSRKSSGDDGVQGNSDTLSLSAAMAAAAASAPAPQPQQAAPAPQQSAPAADPFAMPAPTPAPMADPFAMPAPAPVPAADPFASPDPFGAADAFPFPAPPVATPAPAPFAAAAAMPFEPDPAAFPPAEPLAPASPRRGAFAFEDQPTAAYSLQQAADPFALAAAQTPENPETTRVAAIPRELLQASVRPPTQEAIPMPAPRSVAPPPAAIPLPSLGNSAVALSEEQHFQEVFREFVTTREKCGEPADGLTYDKFVQKLRKNKEQLVQKYACKTVRFQVYVKEGKAALKATPVKD